MSIYYHLCIRSLDISQASPFIEMAWERIKAESPSSRFMLLDQPEGSAPSLADNSKWRQSDELQPVMDYQSVISWSIPNERTLEDITKFPEMHTTPGPLRAVYKLSDKRATKMLFEKFGLPTPCWEILDRGFTRGELLRESVKDNLEHCLLSTIPFPLVIKPLWDCMGHGVEILSDRQALTAHLAEDNEKSVLVEEFIDGELGCIEILGTPGHYYFQPPCLTGHSRNGVTSNFDTVRVSHPDLFRKLLTPEVKNSLMDLLNHLRFQGACCVDFIATPENLYFLEINPRISGISCLSSAASGVNSFEATYLISAKKWSEQALPDGCSNAAVQIGGAFADKYLPLLREQEPSLSIYRDNMISVDGHPSHSIIAGGGCSLICRFLQAINFNGIDALFTARTAELSRVVTPEKNCYEL